MAALPTGTVTFLFTDIEGSTVRWEHQRQAMQQALARHDAILRAAIEAHGGYVFKTVGDAFYAVFTSAPDALEAARAAQQALQAEAWDEALGVLRVRMALHTGTAESRDGDYFGAPLNRVARILGAGHGGQVLVSTATQELVRDQLPPSAALRSLGEHRLKDLIRPEHIFQLLAPGLAHDFPPLRTLENRPNNLPPQPTPFIGRTHEVEAVKQRLLQPETRLLTLTGPGGTGKTRLGLQVAAEALDDFPQGVWVVDLTAIEDPALVDTTIAMALRVQVVPGQAVVDALKAYLAEKQLLLVLDNFEQLLPAAPLVAELLAAAPRLNVLVMSRVPLHLRGEREFPVPPLQLPDRSALPPLEVLRQYDAVRLFIERAQDLRPDFTVTNATGPAVAEICYRLDGLPFAIELAAARTKVLTPEAILIRLSNPLKLLTGGARDAHRRQQTLRATIDWSYNLLEPGEQTLLARLGVFAGGCTMEAVEAVCTATGDLPIDPLDGMASLVDKSLLRQAAGPEGEPRFLLLATIREYASGRLAERGEAPAIQEHHARFFLRLAEQAEPHLSGAEQVAWLTRLVHEYDNLRAALEWGLRHPESDRGLKLAGTLLRFWQLHGDWTEAGRWLRDTLANSGSRNDTLERAKALWAAAVCDRVEGDFDSAGERVAESATIFRSLGDKRGLARALGLQAMVMAERGDQTARRLGEEVAALAREVDDKEILAAVLHAHGFVAYLQSELTAAQTEFEESARLSREVGDRWRLLINLRFLSHIARLRANYTQAGRLVEESLALARELGNRLEEALALRAAGEIAQAAGDDKHASEQYAASLELFRDLGYKWEVGAVRLSQANLLQLQGDYDRSAALLEEGLLLVRDTDESLEITRCLSGIAGVACARRVPIRSARLLGAVSAMDENVDSPWFPLGDRRAYEQALAETRAQLDAATFEAAWAEGRAMSLEQAIAYALEETPSG